MEAWQALDDFVQQMDYEDSEFVLQELSDYRLPEEDARTKDLLRTALDGLDWMKMGDLIREALARREG